MTRQQRLLLASLLAACVGMVLACGGANQLPQPKSPSPAPESPVPQKQYGPVPSLVKAGKTGAAAYDAFPQPWNSRFIKDWEEEVRRTKHSLEVAEQRIRDAESAYAKGKEAENAYRAAKAEFEAARKLKNARRLVEDARVEDARSNPGEADRLRGRAAERYREVLKSFPATQAAADAQVLLEGKELPDRPMPSDPDLAKSGQGNLPTEKLSLDAANKAAEEDRDRLASLEKNDPPYFASEQERQKAELAALPPAEQEGRTFELERQRTEAEAAHKAEEERQRKAEANAEAASKAEEEYDADGLVLLRKTVRSSNGEITGTVVNRRSSKLVLFPVHKFRAL